ncbi:hypothetical protein DW1_2826 [Proteiniborus sp. DW1]|uniref:hypothetical protein n=1 Tax=Proteiniborus sp. DW1 TaxID=1889883 RepID=UPI00092E0FF9|nr:hypothetical protein [Proteiniborus sp. DW1]SCG84386.1 hypothetical protein DW1_2826 [Proteiniborus sp. DW1]
MYNFEYELTEQDYISFNLHFFNTSKSSTRMLVITRLLLGLLILISSKIVFHRYSIIEFIISLILAIIVVLIFNPFFYWLFRLRIKWLLKEGSKGDMFGNRKICISEDGIHSEKPSSTLH